MKESGFREVTRVADARERLRRVVDAVGETDRLPLTSADGRALAEAVTAARDVPHYARAAMDGWAVRAEDTVGASDRSPVVLRETDGAVGRGEAVRVHTGSELPDGADAVVMIEETARVPRRDAGRTTGERGDPGASVGDDVEVADAVAGGENVGLAGEDVEADQPLFEPGHQLRPSDLGLLRSTGVDRVAVYRRPEVGVIPTGEELVEADPAPGEIVETNGLTVSALVERWGGAATYRDPVVDDESALRAAIQRDLTRDVVVTTGGSSVGERDLVPEIVADLGEVLVHGVALKPGHPCGLGVVEGTPVVMLPGYPVACIVNAVQFLRPAVKWTGNLPLRPFPTRRARLARKIPSEPGVKTFARVALDDSDDDLVATPTRASGAGVLSSVALADGWVVVPEEREGIPGGETVAVEDWEYVA